MVGKFTETETVDVYTVYKFGCELMNENVTAWPGSQDGWVHVPQLIMGGLVEEIPVKHTCH